MGDTADPRVALTDKDVTVRAAAAREVARIGSFTDLELLITMAQSDKSPSVRLYTAAAAADIAMRLRGDGKPLTRTQRAKLIDWVGGTDPGKNPSLLMVWAALPERKALDRLSRMLRDPRNGVRAGAATALRRMALASGAIDEGLIPSTIGSLLDGGRLPPDAILELVRIAGEAGYIGLMGSVRSAASAGRPHGAAVAESIERMSQRSTPEGWKGLWISTGADVFEPDGDTVDWLVVTDTRAWGTAGSADLAPSESGTVRLADRVYRMIWAPRLAETGMFTAVQAPGLTLWRHQGKALAEAAERYIEHLAAVPEACLALIALLDGVEGAAAPRVQATLAWRGGDLAQAEARIDPMCAVKKPRSDLYWIQANVKLGLGDLDSAREAVDHYLERTAARAPHRGDAEALRASLGA